VLGGPDRQMDRYERRGSQPPSSGMGFRPFVVRDVKTARW
jgi:hypothetical protein